MARGTNDESPGAAAQVRPPGFGSFGRAAPPGDRTERLLAELLEGFSRRAKPIRVVRKSAFWHQRAAHQALRIVTLGGQRSYLTAFVTTLGHTIYVPDDFEGWPAARRYEVLRHEAVHVAQFERYGWPLMTLVYGVLPFPFGVAYFRARLEMAAYAETLRAVADVEGLEAARDPALHDFIVKRFTGPDYGWMWPFDGRVRAWIAEALAGVERDHRGTASPDPGRVP